MKFFIDRQAFHMEKLISSLPSLSRTVMQPNFVSNADEACCAPLGYIFPPHTITETCMSLDSQLARDMVPKKPVEVPLPTPATARSAVMCCCSNTPASRGESRLGMRPERVPVLLSGDSGQCRWTTIREKETFVECMNRTSIRRFFRAQRCWHNTL